MKRAPHPRTKENDAQSSDKKNLSKIYYTISRGSCQVFFERKTEMTILEQLYEAYCENLLSVKPPEPSVHENYLLTRLEEKLGLSKEQTEYFEKKFFEMRIEDEKRFFAAGFKVALQIIAE